VWFAHVADANGITFNPRPREAGRTTYHLSGAQVEVGAFPTSYIPTTSAAATRALDVATAPVGSWFNPMAGSLVADAMIPSQITSANSEVLSIGATGDDQIILRTLLTSGVTQGLSFVGGVDKGSAATANGVVIGANFKTGLAYTVPALSLSVALNGNVAAIGTVTETPTLAPLNIGSGRAAPINGYVRRVRYWPRAFSAEQLQAITQ
jgi:hypothetical protein